MSIPSKTCCGCTACMAACPTKSISMVKDEHGFYQPEINQNTCVHCDLCEKVCPQENRKQYTYNPEKAVALQIADSKKRNESTSGGAFTVLSDEILSRGGFVAGVIYSDEIKAVYCVSDNKDDRDKMRGSKYVESFLGDTFTDIENILKQDRYVLFTGTPCCVDGLLRYLETKKTNTEKLYTCGIICHGTPSPRVFEDHINYLQTKRGKKIIQYRNRPKTFGWHEHNETAYYSNRKNESQSKVSQNHKDLFYAGYSLRECCFSCQYAGNNGSSDFIIGDFWGIEHIMPEIDDNKGTSVVLINSEKGEKLFSSINGDVAKTVDIDKDKAIKYNHIKPSGKPALYDEFWSDYNKHGYKFIIKKYAGDKLPDRIIYYIKKRLRRILVKLKVIGY